MEASGIVYVFYGMYRLLLNGESTAPKGENRNGVLLNAKEINRSLKHEIQIMCL